MSSPVAHFARSASFFQLCPQLISKR
uniref:Uncharacterized protein n=1 Tax=Anguilla anguilla TaxID=7936 RepID=A0A0E9SVQ0_ANGAN